MINNKVDILKNVSFFQTLSKMSLNKYQNFFNEETFVRGQYA